MEEALDQKAIVNFPSAADEGKSDFRITRIHSDLSLRQGSESICSIPMSHNDRILGVLTLERSADRPSDPEPLPWPRDVIRTR